MIVNLMMVVFIVKLVVVNFSTDLISYKPPDKIESVEDIIERDLRPLFTDYYPTYEDYKFGKIPVNRKLWSKCSDDEDQCIIGLTDNRLASSTKKVFDGTHVMFARELVAELSKRLSCQLYDTKKIKFDAQLSPPISSKITSYIYNKEISKEKESLITKLYFTSFFFLF
jgi:hypothetical protein